MAYSFEPGQTTFTTEQLETQGYPHDVAVDHPANAEHDMVYDIPLTTKDLVAQGYPLPVAQNHPDNEEASDYCLPTTDELVSMGYPRSTAEQLPFNRDRAEVRERYAGQLAAEQQRRARLSLENN